MLRRRQGSARRVTPHQGAAECRLELGRETPRKHRNHQIEAGAAARSALEIEQAGDFGRCASSCSPQDVVAKQVTVDDADVRSLTALIAKEPLLEFMDGARELR